MVCITCGPPVETPYRTPCTSPGVTRGAAPNATPVATPCASPNATPVAAHNYTPVATPVAAPARQSPHASAGRGPGAQRKRGRRVAGVGEDLARSVARLRRTHRHHRQWARHDRAAAMGVLQCAAPPMTTTTWPGRARPPHGREATPAQRQPRTNTPQPWTPTPRSPTWGAPADALPAGQSGEHSSSVRKKAETTSDRITAG
jgi:hypothetical protein